MFALHFVFIPLINRHLQRFVEGWCNHRMRTENNKTLLLSGMMTRQCELGEDFILSEVIIFVIYIYNIIGELSIALG